MSGIENQDDMVARLRAAERALLDGTLEDPEFILKRCNPQTISLMSDIAVELRTLYPEINPVPKSVLDVGSRTGVGAWFMQTVHHPHSYSAIKMKVTALDIEDRYKAYAEAFFPGVKYMVGNLFNLADRSYDLVICSHTIEHVPDPRAFITQLCRVAREYVVVACPFREPRESLVTGHLHSIDMDFINQFEPCLVKVYDAMQWLNSKACIFAIRCQGSGQP